MISCPLSSLTRKRESGSTSCTVPRVSISSSLAIGCRGSERADVRGLRALGALLHFELDLGACVQRAEAAVVADLAVVREQVLGAIARGDEAEALAVVEPLHGAGLRRHGCFLWE